MIHATKLRRAQSQEITTVNSRNCSKLILKISKKKKSPDRVNRVLSNYNFRKTNLRIY